MENKIYQGERLAIAGQLREDEELTTSYDLEYKVFSGNGGTLLQSGSLTLDTGSNYYTGEINTNNLSGAIRIRFIAKTPSGDIAINNEDITKFIYC